MRDLWDKFKVNGKPIFTTDADIEMLFSDLDSSDSGRDEGGVMHRIVIRYKVGKWTICYSTITEEEKQYMESLFPDAEDFTFEHPDRIDSSKQVSCQAYRSSYPITWNNAVTGLWKNYKLVIVEN